MPVLGHQLETPVIFLGMEINLTMIPMGKRTLATQTDHFFNIHKRPEMARYPPLQIFSFL